MLIWIIYDTVRYERNYKFVEFFIEEANKLSMEMKLILVENLSFGTNERGLYINYNDENVIMPDCAIIRTIDPLLSLHLEMMNIKVYNNPFVSQICNDKARTIQIVSQCGVPLIPTEFIKKEYIENKRINILNDNFNNEIFHDSFFVVKTVDGHGGKDIHLIEKNKMDNNILKELSSNKDIIIQPYVIGGGKDVRVYVLNGKIQKAILRTSSEGFKSNYSLGGKIEEINVDCNLEKYVNDIIDYFYSIDMLHTNTRGMFFVGIDFIIDKNNNYYFNEIEDVVGCRMLYQCSNINIVREYLLNL